MHDPLSRAVACACALASLGIIASMAGQRASADWDGYAGDPQHTALSDAESQPLSLVRWNTPVDLHPQYNGNALLVHYGSPIVTDGNTVIVPVKTGTTDGFELNAFNGATGALMWSQPSNYTLPPKTAGWPAYSWTPSYGPTLAPNNTVYYAGAGGTVYSMANVDSNTPALPTQQAFFGLSTYTSNADFFNANFAISTPITADAQGNVYFGYATSGVALTGFNNSQPLTNGIAHISATGVGTFFQAQSLTVSGVSAGMTQVVSNSAPAISNDGHTVYVAMSSGNFGAGRLVALDTSTLAPTASVALIDPKTGGNANMPNNASSSPMVGPDGDVYMGVYDNANTSRGWMTHFSADLSVTKPTGGFGWDDTPAVVPASMVPSYHGTSTYLLMTKYNNYNQPGGNMIAILDPNDTQLDTRANSTGVLIMKEILTLADSEEWCINTAAVDPATDSVLVNNEDGSLYRWNLATNTLTEAAQLTNGLGEAYTPTLIGADGTVYAINNATLFAVGVPTLAASWKGNSANWSDAAQWTSAQPPANSAASWFDTTISAGAVNLDIDATVHTLTLGAGASMSGAANLTVSGGTITGSFNLTGTTTVAGGVLTFAGATPHAGNITGTGALVVNPSTALVANAVSVNSLFINGSLVIRPGLGNAGTSKVSALYVGNNGSQYTGSVDLGDARFIVQTFGLEDKTSKLAALAAAVTSGAGSGWTGNGISSSIVAADPAHKTVLLIDNALFQATAFGGLPVDANSLLLLPTYIGDANLDQKVDPVDLALLAGNYGQATARGVLDGDFNKDGVVNVTDLGILATDYGLGASGVLNLQADLAQFPQLAGVSVPEPATLSLFAFATIALLKRRKI